MNRRVKMKQNQNSRRVNEIARECVSSILLFDVNDPNLRFVTVSGCEVAIDKSFMKIYVSCSNDSYEAVMSALEKASPYIRSQIAHKLNWRVTPSLSFELDKSIDEAERINIALENVPSTMSVEKDEDGYPIKD